MAEETKLVAVVIPVYKSHLSAQDRRRYRFACPLQVGSC